MLQEDNVCSESAAAKELGLSFQGLEEILPAYLR